MMEHSWTPSDGGKVVAICHYQDCIVVATEYGIYVLNNKWELVRIRFMEQT